MSRIRHALRLLAQGRSKRTIAEQTGTAVAQSALERIGVLYRIEKECHEAGLDAAGRYEKRQREAVPVLAELGAWMKEQYAAATPSCIIGKALAYSIRRWEALSRYVEDGMLEIDNNPVERAIRPVAIGRNNYIFAGSHDAA